MKHLSRVEAGCVILPHHGDIAQRISRDDALKPDIHATGAGREIERYLVLAIAHIGRAPRHFDDPAPIKAQPVATAQPLGIGGQVRQDERADTADDRRHPKRPTIGVKEPGRLQILVGHAAPFAGKMPDPGPGELHHVKKRLLGGPVADRRKPDRHVGPAGHGRELPRGRQVRAHRRRSFRLCLWGAGGRGRCRRFLHRSGACLLFRGTGAIGFDRLPCDLLQGARQVRIGRVKGLAISIGEFRRQA